MNTINLIKYLVSLTLIVLFFGCQNLDYDESTGNDKSEVFEDFTRSKNFVTGIYAYLPSGLSDGTISRAGATDEAEDVNVLSSVHKFTDGSWSAIQPLDNVWSTMYEAIRACNIFLEESKDQKFIDQRFTQNYSNMILQYNNFSSEVRFLRAFFYFELIKRYKDVPLITTVLTPSEAINVKQEKYEDLVEFIVKECTDVAALLPLDYTTFANLTETGRATKGAALALKSRVLLYAASPLFNKTVPDSPEYSAIWRRAALAAKEVLDLRNGTAPVYQLGTYQTMLNNVDSRELIFERREAASSSFERNNNPVGLIVGNTGLCPTQNLVDAYEMSSSGISIDAPGSGYQSKQPYSGRDSRLSRTVFFNGSSHGNGGAATSLEIFEGGKNGLPQINATTTGYYLKKYLIESTNFDSSKGSITPFSHVWVYFRYGEILLNYAEAMNEAFGPNIIGDMPVASPGTIGSITALAAVNQVRRRTGVGMPVFPSTLSKEAFRLKLRNERRVELAFEDHRFWDVRRWMIGDQTKEIYAMKVTGTKAAPVYEKVLLKNRIYQEKMNLYPKPQSELFRNRNLTQNPGW